MAYGGRGETDGEIDKEFEIGEREKEIENKVWICN